MTTTEGIICVALGLIIAIADIIYRERDRRNNLPTDKLPVRGDFIEFWLNYDGMEIMVKARVDWVYPKSVETDLIMISGKNVGQANVPFAAIKKINNRPFIYKTDK